MTVQHIAGRVAAPPGSLGTGRGGAAPPAGFDALLQRAGRGLTVSAHAAQRLDARGIDFSDAVRDRVGEALDALDAKGRPRRAPRRRRRRVRRERPEPDRRHGARA